MTISVMRYISDLRIGRVNPQHFNFDINTQEKKYDLPEFVSDNAVDADDVPKLIGTVEPDNDQYKATEAALSKYLELAKTPVATLPDVTKTVSVGGGYPAAEALAARLKVEGDLEDAGVAGGTAFTKELSEGVKNYQMRHGFTPDGKLTAQTVASMNVPLSERATQLALSLERWRWLPGDYLKPRLMVNLPEFLLRGI